MLIFLEVLIAISRRMHDIILFIINSLSIKMELKDSILRTGHSQLEQYHCERVIFILPIKSSCLDDLFPLPTSISIEGCYQYVIT